jgi:hypothetical protein
MPLVTNSPVEALAHFAPRIANLRSVIGAESAREYPSFTHLLGYKADAEALSDEIDAYLDTQRDEDGSIDAPSAPYRGYNTPEPVDERTEAQKALFDLVQEIGYHGIRQVAEEALNGCGTIPVGTYVRFATKTDWGNDTRYDEGTVAKVTERSYVIDKRGGGTARLNKESAHKSVGYSYSEGRSLRVVRTADEQREWAAGEADRQREAAEQAARQRAIYEAQQAVHQAQREQAHLLEYARQIARQNVLEAFAEEIEALALQHLTDLAQDAPGREESTLAPEFVIEI